MARVTIIGTGKTSNLRKGVEYTASEDAAEKFVEKGYAKIKKAEKAETKTEEVKEKKEIDTAKAEKVITTPNAKK